MELFQAFYASYEKYSLLFFSDVSNLMKQLGTKTIIFGTKVGSILDKLTVILSSFGID